MLRTVLLLSVLAYVLPGPDVIEQISKSRHEQPPIAIEATLRGVGQDWPEKVTIDAHPEYGTRVHDGEGGRWLLQQGRVVAGTKLPAPPWVPDLEILVLESEPDLHRWLERSGIEPSQNELARCGESDCFVLGRRWNPAQLWVDKDTFDIVRVERATGQRLELSGYKSWNGRRFPAEIAILSKAGEIGRLEVSSVQANRDLTAEDLSPQWVQDLPASTP